MLDDGSEVGSRAERYIRIIVVLGSIVVVGLMIFGAMGQLR
jgi:hypothetical protein